MMSLANATKNSVQVGGLSIGAGQFTVIAGPCSIESEAHFNSVAEFVALHGASLLRGGIFKLRTSPESFQGLEAAGYQIAKNVKARVGLGLVSEITDPRQMEELESVVDVYQVGSRNMHNYALLKELGKTRKPVLLKRGFAGLVKEWLLSADYLRKHGNPNVILCERGIRTFETATRNTLDLNAVAYVKKHSDLPVLVDPSHGTGMSELVAPLALASAAVGADGIIVEVHPTPETALSDGFQALTFAGFESLMQDLKRVLPALGSSLNTAGKAMPIRKQNPFESQIQL